MEIQSPYRKFLMTIGHSSLTKQLAGIFFKLYNLNINTPNLKT
jgi:hypothetical protein